jgi:dTDP-4-amino-4,6-dideoxygalactose transaminase
VEEVIADGGPNGPDFFDAFANARPMKTKSHGESQPSVAASAEKAAKPMRFPFLDLRTQFAAQREEILAAVTEVFESQQFILGEVVRRFEEAVAGFIGVREAVGCASGTDALELALKACEIGPGDEVITTPFTFGATAAAIANVGARPVFADIQPDTFNINPRLISAAISSKTRAVIPVHLFGLPADMRPILDMAGKRGFPVIEDAAQAIGAAYQGKLVGSLGALGCFSFYPTKNLGGAGDGGLLTTNDSRLAERLRLLRDQGCREKYQYEILGTNSRLDALQAAVLRVKLPHLNDWTKARQEKARSYREFFAKAGLDQVVKLPSEAEGSEHVFNLYVLRCPRRDSLKSFLAESGISSEVYYPRPLHLQPAYSYLGYREGQFPEAEKACREVLAIPLYPELAEEHQIEVAGAIAAFYRSK